MFKKIIRHFLFTPFLILSSGLLVVGCAQKTIIPHTGQNNLEPVNSIRWNDYDDLNKPENLNVAKLDHKVYDILANNYFDYWHLNKIKKNPRKNIINNLILRMKNDDKGIIIKPTLALNTLGTDNDNNHWKITVTLNKNNWFFKTDKQFTKILSVDFNVFDLNHLDLSWIHSFKSTAYLQKIIYNEISQQVKQRVTVPFKNGNEIKKDVNIKFYDFLSKNKKLLPLPINDNFSKITKIKVVITPNLKTKDKNGWIFHQSLTTCVESTVYSLSRYKYFLNQENINLDNFSSLQDLYQNLAARMKKMYLSWNKDTKKVPVFLKNKNLSWAAYDETNSPIPDIEPLSMVKTCTVKLTLLKDTQFFYGSKKETVLISLKRNNNLFDLSTINFKMIHGFKYGANFYQFVKQQVVFNYNQQMPNLKNPLTLAKLNQDQNFTLSISKHVKNGQHFNLIANNYHPQIFTYQNVIRIQIIVADDDQYFQSNTYTYNIGASNLTAISLRFNMFRSQEYIQMHTVKNLITATYNNLYNYYQQRTQSTSITPQDIKNDKSIIIYVSDSHQTNINPTTILNENQKYFIHVNLYRYTDSYFIYGANIVYTYQNQK